MKLLSLVRWMTHSLDSEVSTHYKLFNGWITVAEHAKGCRFWWVELRLSGCQFVNFTRLPDSAPSAKPRHRFVTIRAGSHYVRFGRPIEREFSNVRVLENRVLGLADFHRSSSQTGA